MKKFVSIILAVVMIAAVLCTPVSALDLEKKSLLVQIWAQDTATWSWKSSDNQQNVALGDSKTFVFTKTDDWVALDTSATINMGLQILDETLTANGEHSTVKYELSDLVIKATGYDDLVVKVAGVKEATHDTVRPDWTQDDSVVGGAAEDYNFSPADIGITATADYTAWFKAIESMTVTVKYLEYNGEGADASADDTTPAPDTTPEPDTTAPETTAPETTAPTAPKTGLALAVVPAVMALAAVAVSKKH